MDYDGVIETLMAVGAKYGFRPDVPFESEDYFRELVSTYTGPEERFSNWLEEQVSKSFRSLMKPPEWLQSPEWPIFQGRPMLYVGQIDLPRGSNPILNHDASYYVFLDYETGSTQVVVQAL
jgi:hypothetical protein